MSFGITGPEGQRLAIKGGATKRFPKSQSACAGVVPADEEEVYRTISGCLSVSCKP